MDSITKDNILKHYGVIRRSGRYPWGSGGNAYQSATAFKAELEDLRKQGLTDSQIAEGMGIKTTELRNTITKTTDVIRSENRAMAKRLKYDKQMSTRAISERMLGTPNKESTVRGWLKEVDEVRDNTLSSIANLLRGHLGTKKWLDVGKGNELYLGVSDVKLRAAVSVLTDEGYKIFPVKLPQLGTDKLTNYKILGHPDSTWGEARRALLNGDVHLISEKSDDGGLTFTKPKEEPVSINSKRIEIRYGDEGGSQKDGVIEVRRGVPELDLGANRYAQVRVAVDGTHYLKGMAIYADDLPAGTDVLFNTNKNNTGSKLDVMKELKLEPENAGNRFGAITHPMLYKDSKGVEHTSALNAVNEEGAWDGWSKSLSAQMLSKQSLNLASKQLALARKAEQEKLDDILALTNPVVKKRLLLDFAESADSAAVHLKAKALPNQSSHVILPMTAMRTNEVYAPNFDSGTKVALVRYPHGGPFEIPQLTVNNNNRTAKKLMGNARDAIGIHPLVAKQLSGADFDGDSVLVIPNNSNRVKSKPPLEELEKFDPKESYPNSPGMTVMTKANTQKEMGKVSNLITDMTIKGAKTEEIARAVKHSMVVIDAEKHELDYKLSERDNGIAALKTKYQGGANKGASTLISRSTSVERAPQYRDRRVVEDGVKTPGRIDPETGKLVRIPTGKTYVDAKGITKIATTKTTKGAYTDDARTLSSGEPIEEVYANHANSLKAMANSARKVAVSIKNPVQSTAAKYVYAKEVASLKAKLHNALMNAPLERRAQAIGNATARARIDATPNLDNDDIKKIKYTSLSDARLQTGAGKQRIGSVDSDGNDVVPFTEREWEAVQSGAVSSTMLREILNNSNMDRVKELATPTYRSSLTTGQIALAKSMAASGRNLSEIAAALGIPRTTLADNLEKA